MPDRMTIVLPADPDTRYAPDLRLGADNLKVGGFPATLVAFDVSEDGTELILTVEVHDE